MPLSVPDVPVSHSPGRRAVHALRGLIPVRDDEVAALAWSCLFAFSMLGGNYILRPLRDEMGVAAGPQHLPALFLTTLAAMLVANPLFAALVGRCPRRSLIPVLFRGLGLSLLGFYLLLQSVPDPGASLIGRAFFVWASLVNLLVVSVVWGCLADRFDDDQGRRLFGPIAAGGTLGAIAGSGITTALAPRVGPIHLLLVVVGLIELGIFAAGRLARRLEPDRASEPRPIRVRPFDGIRRTLSCPYLLGLGTSIVLFTMSSSIVYLEQARLVGAAIPSAELRAAFFARIDLMVNLLGLLLQALIAGRVIAGLGVGGSAAVLPAFTLAGFVALTWRPSLAMLVGFQVLRRALDYAVSRPTREVMYTVVRREDKYAAKSFIDTVLYRAGDALGAWSYGLLAAPRPIAAVVVVLSGVWIALSLRLGRRQAELARQAHRGQP